ncbi:MAG: DsbA family protein [Candidatus Methanoperedens sp.]|nr:DsbA family protein [Candidatus Methanoperedens sp.]CAG1008848.1 Thiol:disulfide interchange protein DsbA [Methanosarcinales archaeon]
MAKKRQKLPEKKSGLKTIHIILALLVISALAIYFLNSGGKSPENLPDDNYKKLNTTIEPGKVKIIEFLNFGCSHCNDLRKNMPQLLQKYGAKVEITYIPINFVSLKQSTKSVEAYIIAEQMGKGDEMLDALFDAKFDKGMDILESTIAIENVAESIGLGPDFNQKLGSGDMKNAANYNLRLANDYKIAGTPAVFINGKFQEDFSIANLDKVVGSLLEQGN